MLKHLDLRKILFIDIETVPAIEDFSSLDDEWKALWDRKASFLSKAEEEDAESLYKRAGIYAEFGKVICASLGYLHFREGTKEFRLTSIYGEDEKEVLEKTASLLIRFNKDQDHLLCAHNGKLAITSIIPLLSFSVGFLELPHQNRIWMVVRWLKYSIRKRISKELANIVRRIL